LILNVFAAMGQFEHDMMLERQREGIAKAKAEGKCKDLRALRLTTPSACSARARRLLT
jgi:DNA invertase Pin-like site-specific DNA recombinase